MKNIVIVAKNQETHFIHRVIEEAGQNNCDFFDPWKDLILPEGQRYLVRTTGIHHSDLDLLMLGSLEQSKLVNPLESLKIFRSKASQYQWMERESFPVLPWLDLVGHDPLIVEKFFRLYPYMVVKPHCGQGGWGIEILTWDSFKSWWKKRKNIDEQYLIQPYQKDSEEFRYFFIKNEWSAVLKRTAKHGVAANFKNQGHAEKAELPIEILTTLHSIVNRSGLYYGAIDLLVDDLEFVILDVNSVPGVEQLEAVTGENVMARLLSAKFFCQ